MIGLRLGHTSSARRLDTEEQWFYCPVKRHHPRLRLICFPYAGGNAAVFRSWTEHLPQDVELLAVELPGHQRRFCEPLIEEMDELLDRLVPVIAEIDDVPFAFFGHSMGGLVAFELARRLQAIGGKLPVQLFISASTPPGQRFREEMLHTMPDSEFIDELRKLGGIPDEVLNFPDLMALVTPILRADVTLAETWESPLGRMPVQVPMVVFGGKEDGDSPEEKLAKWRPFTTGRFALNMLPGDHFFLQSERPRLLSELGSELSDILAQKRAARCA